MKWSALYVGLVLVLLFSFAPTPIANAIDTSGVTTIGEDEALKIYKAEVRKTLAQAALTAIQEAEEQLNPPPQPEPKPEPKPEPEPKKVAYLTFDDGPNSYTAQILDELKKENVQATFFLLGPQIERYEETAKRIVADGHSPGLHGMTHVAKKVYASTRSLLDEVEDCNTILERVTGVRSKLFRAPYGSKPWMPDDYRDATAGAGYRLWDWNVDSYDSRAAEVPAEQIVAQVKQQVQGKERAVILLHDKKTTVEALPQILADLKAQGFVLKRVESDTKPLNFWNDER
ncbi:MAG TPA: polysaccharide deacetylase family protein [Bacilli bacterium]|nr:polysaccharide deacetylase family protein [Bacilli bacterium]